LRRNGGNSVPGLLSLSIPGIDATALLEDLPDLALATGAACNTSDGLPSSVLTAIGLDAIAARGTIRVGLGRFTTEAEIDRAIDLIGDAARRQ